MYDHCKLLNLLCERGVLLKQLRMPLGYLFPVVSVRFAGSLVAFSLACLSQENQRGRVRSLSRKTQVQQDKRIRVPVMDYGNDVEDDPQDNEEGLADYELGSTEEPGKILSRLTELVPAERSGEVPVVLLEVPQRVRMLVFQNVLLGPYSYQFSEVIKGMHRNSTLETTPPLYHLAVVLPLPIE